MPARATDRRSFAKSGQPTAGGSWCQVQAEPGKRSVGPPTICPGLALAVALVCLSTPAAAIPSPELIVGTLTSLSQLGALLSALLGGSAVVALRRGGRTTPARSPARHGLLLLVLLVATLLGAFNFYQWQTDREARQTRLSATLTRPSRLPGQPILDPTLKELSPAEQARHPLGLTTAEAETLIGNADVGGHEIIDIRESAV